MSKKEQDSTLQKNFQTQTTFRRNSRYYDVPAIMNLQNQYSIRRRKPLQSPTNSEKLQSSFTNSTAALSSKLKDQVHKYRNRLSANDNRSDYEREYSSPGSPKLKSFSIEKMTNRDHHHKIQNKPIQDERLFNNFKIQKPDLSQTCDFGKLRGRKFDFQLKHMNDLYHESQTPFQKFYYTTTTMKEKVNYKRQNKQQKRYFFKSKRKQDFPSTVMNPQKVDNGLKVASNFKGSNIKKEGISPFYLQSGRQYPSSLDMRFNTNITNFRKGEDGKNIKPQLDFTVRKLKQDLKNERKQSIKKSKKPEFTRDQLCDYRYFRVNQKNFQK